MVGRHRAPKPPAPAWRHKKSRPWYVVALIVLLGVTLLSASAVMYKRVVHTYVSPPSEHVESDPNIPPEALGVDSNKQSNSKSAQLKLIDKKIGSSPVPFPSPTSGAPIQLPLPDVSVPSLPLPSITPFTLPTSPTPVAIPTPTPAPTCRCITECNKHGKKCKLKLVCTNLLGEVIEDDSSD